MSFADGVHRPEKEPLRTVGECLTLGGHVYPNGRAFGDGKCVYCERDQSPRTLLVGKHPKPVDGNVAPLHD